jgi:pimeloyl-ACP methyl ester carboxylesterase
MSLPLIPVHPEGPRYGAPLVFVPGLWAAPGVWRPVAGLLAHRGWEGWIADVGDVGGVEARADALAGLVAELGRPPVVMVSDGSGAVAVELARRTPLAAMVWVAPLLPGGLIRRAVSPWRVLAALLLRRRVERPTDWAPEAGPAAWLRATEDPALVVDVVRARTALGPLGIPVLLACGDCDPRGDVRERASLSARLGGVDVVLFPDGGGTPLATGEWQAHAGAVHRWLVRRLGETVLELYAEAMAERDEE